MVNPVIRRLVRESVREKLLERSADVYSKFVDEIKRFAKLASNKSLNKQEYNDFIKKYSLPSDLDPNKIIDIVNNSNSDKEIINSLQNLYSDITKNASLNQAHQAADPASRTGSAKIIDKLMKHIWQSEAKNYPDFWENFETWHAVGGIIDANVGIDYSIYKSFPAIMLDELSCYGSPGASTDKLNTKIQEIMLNNPGLGWDEKVHFRIKGNITFAAHFDIVTEWLKLKKENSKENFKKHADFSRIALNSESLIVGPEDKITDKTVTGNNYNEIIVQGGIVTGICCDIVKMIGMPGVDADIETISRFYFFTKKEIETFNAVSTGDYQKDWMFISKSLKSSDRIPLLKILNNTKLIMNLPKFAKLLDYFHKSYPFYDIKTGKKLSSEMIYLIKANVNMFRGLLKDRQTMWDAGESIDRFRDSERTFNSMVYGVGSVLNQPFIKFDSKKLDMLNDEDINSFVSDYTNNVPVFSFDAYGNTGSSNKSNIVKMYEMDNKYYKKALEAFYDIISNTDELRAMKKYSTETARKISPKNIQRMKDIAKKLNDIFYYLSKGGDIEEDQIKEYTKLMYSGLTLLIKISDATK